MANCMPTLYCVVPYIVACVDVSGTVLSGPFIKKCVSNIFILLILDKTDQKRGELNLIFFIFTSCDWHWISLFIRLHTTLEVMRFLGLCKLFL